MYSSSIDNGRSWQKVFGISKYDFDDDFQKELQKNKNLFITLEKQFPLSKKQDPNALKEQLETCVEGALNYNNHSLFGKMLIERIVENYNNSPVRRYLKQVFDRDYLDTKEKVSYLRDNTGHYWRNINIRPAESEDEIFQFPDNLKSPVYSKSFADITAGVNRVKVTKDVALQIGIVTGMTSKQVNHWLRLTSNPELYRLDLVDCIGMFYLDYYAGKDQDCCQKDPKYRLTRGEGHRRLKEVKRAINIYIQKLVDFPEEEGVRIKHDDSNGIVFASGLVQYDRRRTEESKWNILRLTDSMRIRMNASENSHPSLTVRFNSLIEIQDEAQFFRVIDKNLSYFKQFRYSFFENAVLYMKDLTRARKNLRFYGTMNGSIAGYFTRSEMAAGDKNAIREIRRIQNSRNHPKSDILEKLNGIIDKSQAESKDMSRIKTDNYYSVVSFTYSATNLLETDPYYVYSSNDKKKSNDLYNKLSMDRKTNGILQPFSKMDIVKYAVATGHENDIGVLMVSSGYWPIDYLNPALFLGAGITYEELDSIDIFLIYVYQYRDRLIQAWKEMDSGEQNDRSLIRTWTNEFPMASLMALVSRDVQYYFAYILYESYTQKRMEGANHTMLPFNFSYIKTELKNCLVFQTYLSQQMWFLPEIYGTGRKKEEE